MIPITKPFLPPIEKFSEYLGGIWERTWLTNHGPLVNELELRLKEYLNVDNVLYLGNGTIALQIAIKALDLRGEIITTPFSYVATTSSIVWEGCIPVFADIDESTFNIDPDKIEEKITDQTSAILATHCFGNPCDIDAIQSIADKYQLKVIYDAAHCFGTKYKGKSVFNYGDVSTVSFHATKVFHTIEGGAVFTKNPELHRRMSFMRNFGHNGPERFSGVGINGKNSEVHAAMGMCLLDYIDDLLEMRKEQTNVYDCEIRGLDLKCAVCQPNSNPNNSYYAVLCGNESNLLNIKYELEKNEIFPRRYFYPLLSNLEYVNEIKAPIGEKISKQVLCLPLYHSLSITEQKLIIRILKTGLRAGK